MALIILFLVLFLLAVLTQAGRLMVRRRPPSGAQSHDEAHYPFGEAHYPFERIGPLLSPAERSFLNVLEQSVGSELRVWGKVRLADLIRPAAGLAAGPKSAAFNKISRKHVDFVLCDPHTLAVVAVVELDDRSHQRADRRERDTLVDGALAAAGITILHVPCRQGYNVAELRERISSMITAGRSDAGNASPLRLAS